MLKTIKAVLGLILAAIVFRVAFSVTSGREAKQAAQVLPVAAPMPPEQVAFLESVDSFIAPYRDAPNELKKTDLRNQRKAALKKAFKKLAFSKWVGRIKRMGTNRDGSAYIAIAFNSDTSITNNRMFENIEIKNWSALYNKFSEMTEGDAVLVSGTFLQDDRDYLSEASVSESGSMMEPEFVVRYASVDKLPAPQSPPAAP